ncbi:6-hydroxymethylpterin diphosphokinase MptE-like protein [Paenibacillus sp. SGZ-1009]|uniref:motility associated factor glycosyltransferase family protein n=1 Tax=Paenibacillus campi TaxID=3106031 RepID=UPI002AFF25B4|nr:6-hydroxymethylpterin diphosphokinase MptE-like protein [Paenibacillus sp. SGZ-1009]
MKEWTNEHIIKTNFPHLQSLLEGRRTKQADMISIQHVQIEQSSNLYVHYGNLEATIHNEVPLQEASELFMQLNNASIDHMIFFGIGLGHHILQFQRQFPHIPFSVYEPNVVVFEHFVELAVLDEWHMDHWRNLFVGGTEQELSAQLKGFVDRTPGTVSSCALPAYTYLFEQEYQLFNAILSNTLKGKQGNLQISNKFSVYWLSNSLRNFQHVLNTPNILQKQPHFHNQPVIIVSAGPSLNEEIEQLKLIKQERSAYILAVGSALSTMIHHGVYPDAICSYDPNPGNGVVVKQVMEQQIKHIPLIFGSSVGGIDLENYPGPKWHMITSQDTIASYFLPASQTGLPVVHDASSIAIVTLQLLCMMGAGSIILVGQNFAYKGALRYASGIDHIDPVRYFEGAPVVQTLGVHGEMVESNPAFLNMKKEMEVYIRLFGKARIFNTTQGGAHIEGTIFKALQDIRANDLQPNTIDAEWLLQTETNVSMTILPERMQELQVERQKLNKSVEELQHIFKDMHWYASHEQQEPLQQLFVIFDRAFDRWLGNLYSKLLLIPASRAQYELLYSQVENVLKERNPVRKAGLIMHYYAHFLNHAGQVEQQIQPIYNEMITTLHS